MIQVNIVAPLLTYTFVSISYTGLWSVCLKSRKFTSYFFRTYRQLIIH